MKKLTNKLAVTLCIIITLLYLTSVVILWEQVAILRLFFSLLCLIVGSIVILLLFTDIIKFDRNKIYGFKLELTLLGFTLQFLAFILLKGRIS